MSDKVNVDEGAVCPQKRIPILEEDIGKRIKAEYAPDVFSVPTKPPSCSVSILVVDVETTGLNPRTDEVIEIAGTKVKLDVWEDEEVAFVDYIQPLFDFFRQPTRNRISKKITELTGITNEQVEGCRVELGVLYQAFEDADMVCAHNAGFDRPFCDELLPDLKDKDIRWICSHKDVDWRSLGHSREKLELLVQDEGYWFPAHRAINDVNAVAWLMAIKPVINFPLWKAGASESFSLSYTKTPFAANNKLKELGFKFGSNKSWSKNYPSMEAMAGDRQTLTQEFRKLKSLGVKGIVKIVNPSERFLR